MLMGFCSIIVLLIIVLNVSLSQFSRMQQHSLEQATSQQYALTVAELTSSILLVKQDLSNVALTQADLDLDANDVKKNITQLKTSDALNQQERQILTALETSFSTYHESAKQMANATGAEGIVTDPHLKARVEKTSQLLDEQLKKLKYGAANAYFHSGKSQVEKQSSMTLTLLSVLVTVASLGIAIYLTRYLNSQLGIDPYFAKGIAKEIARGDLSRSIRVDSSDTKSLLFALEQMRQQLLARRIQDQKTLKEILRTKFALDTVSVGMMITDDHHNIIYINTELHSIFSNAITEITEVMPDFSLSTIVGKHINEASFIPVNDSLLETLTTTEKIPLTLSDHHMMIVITPVINEHGERLGTVSEWHDQTEAVLVEAELAAVVAAASMGDFTRTFNVQGKDGVMRLLGEGINQLMHTNKVSLNEISRVLSAITRGDLTEKITNSYFGAFGELKESTNATVDKLTGIISQIKEVTDIVHNGVKEIASGNNDLSQRTEKQAVSLQETTINIKELTAAVLKNAENARKANQLAIRATEVASKGGEVIGNVITTMKGINDSSHKVVDIISVINGIAFQTNILALNAAVEAARAGEQGRGFAVVAGEVRNLAKLAAAAADEIKNLIGDSVEKIDEGSKQVTQAGKTMDEILSSIQTVQVIMGNITSASAEQSDGIEQVNKAIAEIDSVTQQNAALVEQAAAAAESVEEQTQSLAATVESFKLN
jgi:methyl-accepting chemotaxis protein